MIPPPADPAVSVIVPARDAAPTLARTLQALTAQAGTSFEVIVVDDGSRDDTAGIARRHEPAVTVIRNERSAGPGAARNRGAAVARAPVLAFTDADCFPTSRWLAHGLEAIRSADLVQGAVLPDPAVTRTPFDRTLFVGGDRGFYQTANLFVRREVFDAVGGFRDWALEQTGRRWSVDRRRGRASRTPIGEDTQFAWSALRHGARSAFAAEALVHHEVVPGSVRDEMADRWHWTRDMPGLVRRVPELREDALYRRYFFNARTARFDLALAGIAAAAFARRPGLALAAAPYATQLAREARLYLGARDAPLSGLGRSVAFALGSPASDVVLLAGLAVGSLAWRCPVI